MALAALYRVIDDKITALLHPYLAIGYGPDGRPYSDVIVKEGNVEIINLFARPQMLTAELATLGVPFSVRQFHCNNVKVHIPWFSWSANPVEVVVDGLLIVLEPTNEIEWTVEQVRASKEHAIEDALLELLRRQATASSANKKKTLFERLKAQVPRHLTLDRTRQPACGSAH